MQEYHSMMYSRPLTIPRRHLLITGSTLTVQALWVQIGHAVLNGPDIQLHRTIVLNGNQGVVMQITRLMTYWKVAFVHVTLTKVRFGMIGEIMLHKTFYNRIPYKIRKIHITMTSWWARRRLKSPAQRLFIQLCIQAQIKENIKAPHHWPLCGECAGDRWIPRTKGQ